MAVDNRATADIAQVVAPVTAVVAVFTSLAVTGVLGQAQRDEATWLIAAFAWIVAGAVAWLVGLLIPVPAEAPNPPHDQFRKVAQGARGAPSQGRERPMVASPEARHDPVGRCSARAPVETS